MKFALAALFVALASNALGALEITAPNANSWWVANSINLVSWTCNDPAALKQYTLVVYGAGALAPGLPILSLLNNFDCSEGLPANGNLPAGTNYTVGLVNPLNRTDIVALSQPFEIKPEGSTYPASITPTLPSSTSSGPTQTGSGNGSGSSTGSGTSSSAPASTSSNAATVLGSGSAWTASIAFLMGAILA